MHGVQSFRVLCQAFLHIDSITSLVVVLARHTIPRNKLSLTLTQTHTQTLKFPNPNLGSRRTNPAKTFEPQTSMILSESSTCPRLLRTATTLPLTTAVTLQADTCLSHPYSHYMAMALCKPSIIPFNHNGDSCIH